MSREHRQLLTGAVAVTFFSGLTAALLAGGVLGDAWLVALYLFSCVLVGLSQQTIP